MIKTIQQYANEKSTSQQNVRQSKKLPLVELPMFALYKGEYIQFGTQKFVEIENNLPENQSVTK